MKASEIIDQAKDAVLDREGKYGNPLIHYERIRKGWEHIVGVEISTEEVGMMLMWLKMARVMENPKHLDNWIDIAGYAGVTAQAIVDKELRNIK